MTHPEGYMVTLLAGQTYTMSFVNGEQLTNVSFLGSFFDLEVTVWNDKTELTLTLC